MAQQQNLTGYRFAEGIVTGSIFDSTYRQLDAQREEIKTLIGYLDGGLKKKKGWTKEKNIQALATLQDNINTLVELRNNVVHEPEQSLMWVTATRTNWLVKVDEVLATVKEAHQKMLRE